MEAQNLIHVPRSSGAKRAITATVTRFAISESELVDGLIQWFDRQDPQTQERILSEETGPFLGETVQTLIEVVPSTRAK